MSWKRQAAPVFLKHKCCLKPRRKALLFQLQEVTVQFCESPKAENCDHRYYLHRDPVGIHVFMYKFWFLLFSHLNRASWSTIRNKLSQAKPSTAAQAHGTGTSHPHTWGQVWLFSGFGFFLISLLFTDPLLGSNA